MSILGDLESGESREEPTDQDWASIRLSLYGLSDLPARIDALTEAVNRQAELISRQPADKRSSTAATATRLDEIEITLAEILKLLDGRTFSDAAKKSVAASAAATKAATLVSESAEASAEALQEVAKEIRSAGTTAVNDAAARAVRVSVEAVDKRDRAAESRARRVIEAAEKVDDQQLWIRLTSAGLVLVPFVLSFLLVVLAGWAVGVGWTAIVDPAAGPWARGAQVGAWTIVIAAAVAGLGIGGVWLSTLLEDARDAWRKKRRKKEKKRRTT